jgi:hypothetical protein
MTLFRSLCLGVCLEIILFYLAIITKFPIDKAEKFTIFVIAILFTFGIYDWRKVK